jgi:peptidoglycan/LPS O-acetylase OafA/YrhL
VRLGEISFAFYLVHQLVIKVLLQPLHLHAYHTGEDLSLTAGVLLASMAAAWVLNVAVERPAQRWLRTPPASPAVHDVGVTISQSRPSVAVT